MPIHYEVGQMQEKLNTTKHILDSEDMTYQNTLANLIAQPCVTVESPAQNKKMTSKDKNLSCENNSQNVKSSKTLEVDSTLSVKGLNPFWNEQCQEINSKLWLPTGIGFADSDLTSLNGLSQEAAVKSWFSNKVIYRPNKNLSLTFSPSFKFLEADSMDCEIIKTKCVRIYPTKEQRQILKNWFDDARFSYNAAKELIIKAEGKKPSWMDIKKQFTNSMPERLKRTPFQIKGIAVKNSVEGFWAAIKAYKKSDKKKPISHKFWSRKETEQSIFITKSAIKEKGIYPRILGEMKYKEKLPCDILDSRLVKRYDNYYLMIPYKTKRQGAENQGLGIVALDPGIRTFQTFYSENSCGYFGYDDFGRIHRLCYHLDDLISRTSKAKGKKKREMKRAQGRMRMKIQNLINEIHFQTANWLVNHFDVILLPTFETSNMAKKGKRKLRAKSVRAMLTYSHYKFKQRLKLKAFEYGKKVIDVCEAYTSKTVSWTGEIKNIGGSREIRSGGITLDRDLNGCRNIFIRSLVDSPTLMSAIVKNY